MKIYHLLGHVCVGFLTFNIPYFYHFLEKLRQSFFTLSTFSLTHTFRISYPATPPAVVSLPLVEYLIWNIWFPRNESQKKIEKSEKIPERQLPLLPLTSRAYVQSRI